MKPCCQNILFPTKWPRKHFSSSWRGKDVAVLHYSYGEYRVEKVRVEDRADCSSWRKVWRRYVDLIIFTFFSDFFRRASLAAMSGIMIKHYCQAWARFETEPKPLRRSLDNFETTVCRLPGKSSVQVTFLAPVKPSRLSGQKNFSRLRLNTVRSIQKFSGNR